MQTGTRKEQAPSYNHTFPITTCTAQLTLRAFLTVLSNTLSLCANEIGTLLQHHRTALECCLWARPVPRYGGRQCSPVEVESRTHHCGCHGCGLCCDGCALLGVLEALCATGRAGEWLVVKADHLDVGAADGQGQRKKEAGTKLYSAVSHLTGTADCRTCVSLSKHPA